MKLVGTFFLTVVLASPLLQAKEAPVVDEALIAKIVERENQVARSLEKFHPIVETYIEVQRRRNRELVPWYDHHFISLAEFSGGDLRALRFKPRGPEFLREAGDYAESLSPTSIEYDPSGFVAQAYPTPGTFDLRHYRFQYLTKEFLGDVRCFVFQVKPAPLPRKNGLFEGKIWVEDQDLTIVRFNGLYHGSNMLGDYFHFDSWRVNATPGLWLPAEIYTAETNLPCCGFWKLNWTRIRFKAQTRFWGYNARFPQSESELAKVVIDPSSNVQDRSKIEDLGPIQEQGSWDRQAENNVSEHLESIGLLSPPGEVEKTLETIVNNIEVTNNFSIDPEIRCRVLLTSNLESVVLGHTIILSRGLIDVLPNEATLAAVLAHGLAYMKLGNHVDTSFAFADKVMFGPRDTVRKLRFVHSKNEEKQADLLAREWMMNSPYKDSLDSVSEFVVELWRRAPHISALLRANIGDNVYDLLRAEQMGDVKALHAQTSTKARALPLGSRVVIDPWNNKTTLMQASAALADENKENMSFEVSPFVLYLRRAVPNKPTQQSSSIGPQQ